MSAQIIEESGLAALDEMFAELEAADALYRPSRFWDFFNGKNIEQLRRCGISRFKRTVNQNYYNWLPTDFSNGQLRRLFDHWHKEPSPVPLRARLQDESHVETIVDQGPLGIAEKRDVYAFFVGLLWEYARRNDRLGVMDRLEEPDVGDPIRVMLDGKCISQDIANSARECNAIMSAVTPPAVERKRPLRVAELGAGYGRLAYVFAAGLPCRYAIFDIPPALAISQAYLQEVFPEKKCFCFRHIDDFASVAQEIEEADLCFFTPNQLELFPDRYFDVFASISSLGEMTIAQIENYKQLMERLASEVVYIKQWVTSVNDFDRIVIPRGAYRLSSEWHAVVDRLDDVQNEFFETVYRRGKEHRAARIQRILSEARGRVAGIVRRCRRLASR